MPKKSNKKNVIALTGATGFVGKRFIEIALKKKIEIRALTRKPQSDLEGVTWVKGDLNNKEALSNLVKGVETVIHMAGVVKALNWKGFEDANINGTRNLIEAIEKNHPKKSKQPHFIHISSLTARAPWLSHYGASKRLSENEFQKVSNIKQIVTILRPPAVYGPGDTEILKMFKAFKRGIAPSIGFGDNRFSMIYVDDLVDAICSLINKPPTKPQIFELDDGTTNGYTIRELADIAQVIFDRKILTIPVPPVLLTGIGFMNGLFAKMIHRPAMLTHLKAKEILHKDWVARTNKLEESTDWAAKTPIQLGFEKTISWYKDKKLL